MKIVISIICSLLLCGSQTAQQPEKIHITPGMVVDETENGNAYRLFDEQLISGNPRTGEGGMPTSYWYTGFSISGHSCYAYIDLGQNYSISEIDIMVNNGIGNFNIHYGMPGKWEKIITDPCLSYIQWNRYPVSVTTRYLRFEKTSPAANISELIIYGTAYGEKGENAVSPVIDLKVPEINKNSVTLEWTAKPQHTAYLVRYNHSPHLPGGTDRTIIVENDGTDKPNINIKNLRQGAPYYFTVQGIDKWQNFSGLSNIAAVNIPEETGGAVRQIYLSPHMIVNEAGNCEVSPLADEQFTVGNPDAGTAVGCRSIMSAYAPEHTFPANMIIDLGAVYYISHLYLYDAIEDGANYFRDPVTFYSGKPGSWSRLFKDKLKKSGVWVQHSVKEQTRYLNLETGKYSRIGEIILYGYPVTLPDPLPQVTVQREKTPMDQFIGINGMLYSPIDKVLCAGFVRENHYWKWNDGPDSVSYPMNRIKWDLTKERGWNFDTYYGRCQDNELMVAPVVLESAPFIFGGDKKFLPRIPCPEESSQLSPSSYIAHGSYMYQYAARYGSRAVPEANLKLADGQEKKSGLGKIRYYENWNKPDIWNDTRAYFAPFAYAAMASADYDGHEKKLGDDIGVKNADPDARLVMGGLSSLNLEYVKALDFWGKHHRSDQKAPFDVISMHAYCHPDGKAVSPEQAGLYRNVKRISDYRDRFMPDKELWITEFGYDTHPESPTCAPAIGHYTNEEVQGQWLVRSYLALAAAGADRAAVCSFSDTDTKNSSSGNTSGLVSPVKNGYTPKMSWFYVYTMKNVLSGMHFVEEIPSGTAGLIIYKFASPTRSAYVAWMGTSSGTAPDTYRLRIGGKDKYAKIVELVNESVMGKSRDILVNGSSIDIQVSECPVFVITSETESQMKLNPNVSEKIRLTPGMAFDEQGGSAGMLTDEQDISGDPLYGIKGTPETVWKGKGNVSSAYIDLGYMRNLTYILIFDTHGVGDVTISTGSPGKWTPLTVVRTKTYMNWLPVKVDIQTRYIRLTRHEGQSNFAEVVLYEK